MAEMAQDRKVTDQAASSVWLLNFRLQLHFWIRSFRDEVFDGLVRSKNHGLWLTMRLRFLVQ